jgi:GntR family transcriptional repressor for pyruvate dehydrogenase complex
MEFAFEKLRTDRFSERIAREIQELVITSQLHAGDRLPAERELAARFGVSRTAVREALKLLQERGLVEARTGRGSYVADPGLATVTSSISVASQLQKGTLGDLLEARQCLETHTVTLACERATAEDIAIIQATIEGMDGQLDDAIKFIEIDSEFHSALAAAAHNPFFLILGDALIDLIQAVRQVSGRVEGSTRRAQFYHHELLAAIKARDAARASALVAQHMQQFQRDLEAGGLPNATELPVRSVAMMSVAQTGQGRRHV